MAAAPEDGVRQRDAERTRTEILDEATAEFADRGLAGARVDEIAARTRTTKRMLYYYFGSKQGLYLAVLERAYGGIRALEQQLSVSDLNPARAVRAVAELTFDHHEAHPDFIRLVAIENIHHAEHLRSSPVREGLAGPAVGVLEPILARGRETGMFRDDVDAFEDVWWSKKAGGVGNGVALNRVLPINPQPLVGGQNWFDTVCTVRKVA